MKKLVFACLMTAFIISLPGCDDDNNVATISIKNNLELGRSYETVLIQKAQLSEIGEEDFSRLLLRDIESGEILVSQLIDNDSDSQADALAFQPVLNANEERTYALFLPDEVEVMPESAKKTFSRFVPERTDDYAWENDLVAFRTYGPTAQKMIEENIKGGTLSSGMDCWLKKVDYPIINSWYKKHVDGTGSYHKDTGEGLDNFHVGVSRGCGGIGIWNAKDEILFTSRNFTKWETISEGPLRTKFKLDYAAWPAKDLTINEHKVISLDLGNNLTRYEIVLTGDKLPEYITTGLTLHEKDGNMITDQENGWYSYWQAHGDSEIGMGIVVEDKYLSTYTEHIVDDADLSHLLVHLKPIDGKVVYYAGFGWKGSGQFATEKDWTRYLMDYSERLAAPLVLTIISE